MTTEEARAKVRILADDLRTGLEPSGPLERRMYSTISNLLWEVYWAIQTLEYVRGESADAN